MLEGAWQAHLSCQTQARPQSQQHCQAGLYTGETEAKPRVKDPEVPSSCLEPPSFLRQGPGTESQETPVQFLKPERAMQVLGAPPGGKGPSRSTVYGTGVSAGGGLAPHFSRNRFAFVCKEFLSKAAALRGYWVTSCHFMQNSAWGWGMRGIKTGEAITRPRDPSGL